MGWNLVIAHLIWNLIVAVISTERDDYYLETPCISMPVLLRRLRFTRLW
jgi:hypothetical protein